MELRQAKEQVDTIIRKARVHLYKPIQIAEILHRARVVGDIDLAKLESYRTPSRRWRDEICIKFLGRTSTSSARFQDNLFDANAVPPAAIATLAKFNSKGEVEAYIYDAFRDRFSQLGGGLDLVRTSTKETFDLSQFIDQFRRDPGLSRSVDKVFEIVVYAIFSTLLDTLDVQLRLSINNADEVLEEFSDFAEKVLGLSSEVPTIWHAPHVFRVGVTNAADRGLDMWANFGLAIQIKHLSLTEDMVDEIASGISADRIVIVCKDCDREVLVSVLQQFGQSGRIQTVITEEEIASWYERALRGKHAERLGDIVLERLAAEIIAEFPVTEADEFEQWWNQRGYQVPDEEFWQQ